MSMADGMSSEEKILEMVREQLERPNPPGTEALYGRAARIDSSIRELSLRQFNARYPLRVRREMARVSDESEKSPQGAQQRVQEVAKSDEAIRRGLRAMFHDLAAEVAGAEAEPELIDFIEERLEGYVDRTLDLLSSKWS